MHDAGGMRRRERVGDLEPVGEGLVHAQPVPRDHAIERPPGGELHHDEVDAIGLGDVMYSDDAGVIESRSRLRFLDERRRRSGSAILSAERTLIATRR